MYCPRWGLEWGGSVSTAGVTFKVPWKGKKSQHCRSQCNFHSLWSMKGKQFFLHLLEIFPRILVERTEDWLCMKDIDYFLCPQDLPTNIHIKSCALAMTINSQGFASKIFAIEKQDSPGGGEKRRNLATSITIHFEDSTQLFVVVVLLRIEYFFNVMF